MAAAGMDSKTAVTEVGDTMAGAALLILVFGAAFFFIKGLTTGLGVTLGVTCAGATLGLLVAWTGCSLADATV